MRSRYLFAMAFATMSLNVLAESSSKDVEAESSFLPLIIAGVVGALIAGGVALALYLIFVKKKKPAPQVNAETSFEDGLRTSLAELKNLLECQTSSVATETEITPVEEGTDDKVAGAETEASEANEPDVKVGTAEETEAKKPAKEVKDERKDVISAIAEKILAIHQASVEQCTKTQMAEIEKLNKDIEEANKRHQKEIETKAEEAQQALENKELEYKKELDAAETKSKKQLEEAEAAYQEQQKKAEAAHQQQLSEKEAAHKLEVEKLNADHQQQNAELQEKLSKIDGEWEEKLDSEKKQHEAQLNEKQQAHEKAVLALQTSHKEETDKLNDKLKTIDDEWKTKLGKTENSHKAQLKELDSKRQDELKKKDAAHDAEIKNMVNKHKAEIAEEQRNTAAYRERVLFVKEPRQQVLDYASKAVAAFKLVRNARLKAEEMAEKGVFDDENVNYFYRKSMNKFAQATTDNANLQLWLGELTLFIESGLYSSSAGSALNSVFSGQDDAKKQLASLKTRLHHDVMANYGSAALILLQELTSLGKLSGVEVDKQALRLFSDALQELQKGLAGLEYNMVMVDLLAPFRGSDDVKAVGSVEVDAFNHEAILEVSKIGVRYGGSKEKTEVIVNR